MQNDRRTIVLSASAASCLKACPFKYRNAYYLGIRRVEEAEPLRVGSNWHEGLDMMYMKPGPCPTCSGKKEPSPECLRCGGTGFVDDPLDAVTRMLNYRYSELYPSMSAEQRETERVVLLHSLFAYKYHYDEQPTEVIAREIPFSIPLLDPRTHRAIPNVRIDGKIDKLVRYDGRRVAVMEHKSTSDSVDPSSDYWGHLRLDTQTMLYTYAAQRLQADDLLSPYGINAKDMPISSILYDAWHKPQVKPKKLSKADTEAFIESGMYFNQAFEVYAGKPGQEDSGIVSVDGKEAEVEVLKSGFAIRETPDMFGARLFDDICGRPDYYFGRKVIVRSHDVLEQFEWELFNLYRTIENYVESDSWFHNEFECSGYGKCDYAQFCYTGQELDPDSPPAGFKCIHKERG